MSEFDNAMSTLRRLSASTSHPTIASHSRKALKAAAAPERALRAAVQLTSTERMRLAIRELGAISRSATHPDRQRARRALLEMQATYEGRTLVAGVSYESDQAEELDRQMGLSNDGKGIRVEGDRLILSTVGRGHR